MTAILNYDGPYHDGMAKFLLKAVCKERAISQYRLAILLKMDAKNISRLFRPDYDPKLSLLARVAKALKCRIRDLIRE